MKYRSAIRTNIEAGFATDTSFFIRDDCIGFGNALPSTSRADCNARSLLALLTDDGHEDRNLFPFLYSNSRKGRATGSFMRKAASHFTGLASGASFWNNRDGAHLDTLLNLFSMVNQSIYIYINICLLIVKHFFIIF
jgi:hypothetical protein